MGWVHKCWNVSIYYDLSRSNFRNRYIACCSDNDEETHYTIRIPANKFTDEVGNSNQVESTFEYTYDVTPPVVQIHARTEQDDGVVIFMPKSDTYLAQVSEQDRDYSDVYGNHPKGHGSARSTIDSARAWQAKTTSPADVNVVTQTSGTWMLLELDHEMWIYGVAIQGKRDEPLQAVTKMSIFVDDTLVVSNSTYVVTVFQGDLKSF